MSGAIKNADVSRIQLLSDMLAHLDGTDRVEGRRRRQVAEVAVVLQTNLDAVGQAAVGGASDGEIALLSRQRDTGGAHAVALCRVQDQRSPATPDIQQMHAWFQAELATDQIQLRGLRIVQRLARVGEIGRRVRHVVVEQQPVEVVGQVVMMGDDGPIAALGVQPAGQLRLGLRGFGRQTHRPQPHHTQRRRRPGAQSYRRTGARVRSGQPPGPAQTLGQVTIDIDVTCHVGPRQAELSWAPEQSTQSATRTHHQHRAVSGPGLTAIPSADPNWRIDADGGSEKIRQAVSDGRHHSRFRPPR